MLKRIEQRLKLCVSHVCARKGGDCRCRTIRLQGRPARKGQCSQDHHTQKVTSVPGGHSFCSTIAATCRGIGPHSGCKNHRRSARQLPRTVLDAPLFCCTCSQPAGLRGFNTRNQAADSAYPGALWRLAAEDGRQQHNSRQRRRQGRGAQPASVLSFGHSALEETIALSHIQPFLFVPHAAARGCCAA